MKKFGLLLAIAMLFSGNTVFAYTAKNVMIIIGDKYRHDETFGEKTHQYIPYMWKQMVPKASQCVTFYGNPTFIAQVHLAVLTGYWDDIRRLEPKTNPDKPTLFEYYRKALNKPEDSCYFLTSKKEYYYLEYSNNEDYGEQYKPYFEVTKQEKNDEELYQKLIARMEKVSPSLIVVILGKLENCNKKRKEEEMGPYRKLLKETDELIYRIWTKTQTMPKYKDKTDLIFVNDHGDLVTHEDCNDECKRYLIIVGLGPDMKENYISEKKWRQVNILPTVMKIFGVTTPVKDPMDDFFRK